MSSNTFAEANKKAFDSFATSYNIHPWQQKLAAKLTTEIQSRKQWFGVEWTQSDGKSKNVRLLDYACGTGAASIALWPLVTEIRGMDLSEGMVAKYNEAMSGLDLSSDQAHAIVHDLTGDSVPAAPTVAKPTFDVAIMSLALHHINDPELLMRLLADQVKPKTGVVIIVDFLPFEHGHGEHKGLLAGMAHTIKQHGFTIAQMHDLYRQAGLADIDCQVVDEPIKIGSAEKSSERQMIIARGRRSA